jgi:hypothetical protein
MPIQVAMDASDLALVSLHMRPTSPLQPSPIDACIPWVNVPTHLNRSTQLIVPTCSLLH